MRLFSHFACAGLLFVSFLLPLAAQAQSKRGEDRDAPYAAQKQIMLAASPQRAVLIHKGAGADMGVSVAAQPENAGQSLIERGHYLAVAADCAACHTAREKDNKPFAGGYAFKLPMGEIVSSNITPSKTFGIGNWSEADFARAVRDGVRPDGTHLYPAMPYTEYSLITDADIHALYAYFMGGVAPVDEAAKTATRMNFPFNLPGALSLWNMLFLDPDRFEPDPAVSAEINRGRYLVDGPAHCGTCHTPRNFMMAPQKARYLAGSGVNGWWAPNITPDPVSGIGGWSRQEIVTYLKTGHVRDKSQANGPMAEAVEYSFRYMADADLQAIAAYLETVRPQSEKRQKEPAFTAHKAENTDFTQYEFPLAGSAAAASSVSATANGAVLYNSACAACHGVNGQGADDGSSPSLLQNSAVGIVNPDSLIMTVAYGLNRHGADKAVSMPGFLYSANPIFAALDEEQIAAVVNYVRSNFGNRGEIVTTGDVKTVLAGGKMPFLIEHAAFLVISGIIIGILVLLWLIHRLYLRRRRRHKRQKPSSAVGKTVGEVTEEAAAEAQILKKEAQIKKTDKPKAKVKMRPGKKK